MTRPWNTITVTCVCVEIVSKQLLQTSPVTGLVTYPA